MLAAGTGQLDVINLLLDAGVDINHVRVFFLILFFYAVNQCKVFFRHLMNSKNRLIQTVIFQEPVTFKTVFYPAFLSFNERFLFARQEDNKGKTALHICCEHTRMTRAGRLLLSRGADINHKDHSGRQQFHCTMYFGFPAYFPYVLFLIPYFSCLILYIYIGKTPLDKALQFSKIGTVMFLLQADCQRSPDLMKTEKIRELCGMYPPLTLFLEHEFNEPWNLLRLCRFNIRNSVKPNKLKDIPHQLLLPRTLLNYLTFSDVDLYLLQNCAIS